MHVCFFIQAFYTNLQINFIKIGIIFYIKILHNILHKSFFYKFYILITFVKLS